MSDITQEMIAKFDDVLTTSITLSEGISRINVLRSEYSSHPFCSGVYDISLQQLKTKFN